MQKKALITGITGQDGAYLAKNLIEHGYHVTGTHRRTSTLDFWRLRFLGIEKNPNLRLVNMDITDSGECIRVIAESKPDEIYNLAAQSFVGVSFSEPGATSQVTGIGALNVLEAIRILNPEIKFYQASTSEMFGLVQQVPQNEQTPFYPRSPYGVAKLFAHWMTINYREAYGIFASTGILFNHESPLRGPEFVTRKITIGLANIKQGSSESVKLGNLNAKRDWGYADEYTEGMYLMLQHDEPDNLVLATNHSNTIRDFVEMSCAHLDIEICWEGEGLEEKAVDQKTGQIVIEINPEYYRPTEVDQLIGDAGQAYEKLGWKPKVGLQELSEIMVRADMDRLRRN